MQLPSTAFVRANPQQKRSEKGEGPRPLCLGSRKKFFAVPAYSPLFLKLMRFYKRWP